MHSVPRCGLLYGCLEILVCICVCVCVCVGHDREPCKNDRDAVWAFGVLSHVGSRNRAHRGKYGRHLANAVETGTDE